MQKKNSSTRAISFLVDHPFTCQAFISVVLGMIFGFGYGVLFYLLLLPIGLVMYGKIKNERIVLEVEKKRKEAQKYVDEIKKNKSLTKITVPVFLNDGESAFLEEDTRLNETRAVRKSTGGFAGFRVMKGVTVGGYRGSSESHQEWRNLDTGKLLVTNEKVIFMGDKENRTIPLKKIFAVETYRDAIELSIDGRAKSIMFPLTNPYIWSAVLNILKSVKDPLHLEEVNLNVNFQ